MTCAVLYRWRIKPGREDAFVEAWAEGTKLIHEKCGSYGARLHKGADGLFWSYAVWPSEEARLACFETHDFFALPVFQTMQAAIETRFEEVPLTIEADWLVKPET